MEVTTTVTTPFLNTTLFSGIKLATFGITSLVLCGIFLPPTQLQTWGIPLFFLPLLFIFFGLRRYKKLTHLQTHPYRLTLNTTHLSLLSPDGTPIQTIPLSDISDITYSENKKVYGIHIHLKKTPEPLFFPYFSERSTSLLAEYHGA